MGVPTDPRGPREAAGVARLGDRLARAAAETFVGRQAEVAAFDAALAPVLPAAALMWFHGPGGIGKTTLMGRLRERAEAGGRRTLWIDAGLLQAHPAAFVAALADDDPRRAADPGVLFIDTVERATALHDWWREQFLPALPAHWMVVAAGREPPPASWRHDPAWQGLLRSHELSPLDGDDSQALLRARGVADARSGEALAFARGHPLALALLAELIGQRAGDAAVPPVGTQSAAPPPQGDVVQTLVQRFTRDVASPTQARALRLAAVARHTTLPLLAELLPHDDPAALFDWLRGRSFMRAAPHGLLPHDLVRDVLMADALWRDEADTRAIERVVFRHHYGRIAAIRGPERLHHQAEALFAQRLSPGKREFFDWSQLGRHRVEPATDADGAAIEAQLRRHEGDAALTWLRHWWGRQRDGFRVFWDADGRRDGFLLMLRLGADTSAADRADPAVAAAWSFIGRHRPLAAGDELVLLRHWMHAEQYQAVSAAINLSAMHVVSHLITHPEAAWSVVWMADPAFWQDHFDHVNFARCPDADFQAAGRRFGAFVHDWRFEPAERWVTGDRQPMPFAAASRRPGAAAVPDAAAFVDALREAMRHAADPDALGRMPLARQLGLDGPALQRRLRDAVQALARHPRDAKFRDALWHTYIEPLHKQEQVAAELGVPFRTYRYRLTQGLERLAALLRAG